MNKDNEQKSFLNEQLNWTKEQIAILYIIETKLHEMKLIAIYVSEQNPTQKETKNLQAQLEQLQNDVKVLEKQLYYNQLPN